MAESIWAKPEHHGLLHKFIDNPISHVTGAFASDIKNTVFGLPTATVELVEHPERTGKNIAKATWMTYSPLFHGQYGKFAHGVYDHPLAPLLDLATVFSFGTAGAIKLAVLNGGLEEANAGTKLAKVASLSQPRKIALHDNALAYDRAYNLEGKKHVFYGVGTPGLRAEQTFTLPGVTGVRGAGRRALQEVKWKAFDKAEPYMQANSWEALKKADIHIPKFVARMASPQAKFEKLAYRDIQGRSFANAVWINMALAAGKALTDPDTAPAASREILFNKNQNLVRHSIKISKASGLLKRYSPLGKNYEKRNKVIGLKGDYYFVEDLSGRASTRIIKGLKNDAAKWQAVYDQHAPAAAQYDALKAELDRYDEVARSGQLNLGHTETAAAPLRAKLSAKYKGNRPAQLNRGIINSTERSQLNRRVQIAREAKQKHSRAASRLDVIKKQLKEENKRAQLDMYNEPLLSKVKNEDGTTSKVFDIEHLPNAIQNATLGITRDPRRALRDKQGNYHIVPKQNSSNLLTEAGNSVRFLQTFWRKPHQLWKKLYLGYTPRTITQNTVGNYSIYVARSGGPSSWAALGHALSRFGRDTEAAKLSALAPKTFGYHKDAWLYQHFGDILGNTFGLELSASQGLFKAVGDKNRTAIKTIVGEKAKRGLYGVVSRYADEPIRVGAVFDYLKKSPEVKAVMKERGWDWERAAKYEVARNRTLRDRTSQYAISIAGDYASKGPIERYVADIIPFYLWDKHILKSVGNTVIDTPGRVTVAARLGAEGIEETKRQLGALPEFLSSVIPGQLLPGLEGTDAGRAGVALTVTLNPFAQIGDLANIGEALVTGGGPRPGPSLTTQISPVLSGLVEYMSGRDILTGAELPQGEGLSHGAVGYIGGQIGTQLPYVRLLEQLRRPSTKTSPKGNPLLFAHDKRSILTSLLGIPVRNVSQDKAGQIYKEEQRRMGNAPPKSDFGIPPL